MNKLTFLASPVGVGLLSSIPLVFAMLIPPDYYEIHMYEPYLIFESQVVYFWIFCTLCFLLGAYCASFVFGRADSVKTTSLNDVRSKMFAIRVLMIICIFLDLFSFFTILANTGGLFSLIASGRGQEAKLALNTDGAFTLAQPLLISVNQYCLFSYLNYREYLEKGARKEFAYLLLIAFVTTMFVALAKVARYEFIPIIIGVVPVFLAYAGRGEDISWRKLGLYALVTGVILVLIFSMFAMLRGANDFDDNIEQLIGYGPASINHLGGILIGNLRFYYSGTMINAFPFLNQIPIFESIFKIGDALNLPTFLDVLQQEFLDTLNSGMNSGFNWITQWGYIYVDLGWLTFPLIFVIGVFVQLMWQQFLSMRVLGLMMYPQLYVAIFGAATFNGIFKSTFLVAAVFSLLIRGFEKMYAHR